MIVITHKRLLEILTYNSKTGLFTWNTAFAGGRGRRQVVRAGDTAGSINKVNGYIMIYIEGKSYSGHRLAWLYTYGKWPENYIDHINRNKSDNRIANLRDVRSGPNLHNRAKKPEGIHKSKQRPGWTAYIGIRGKNLFLGRFNTEAEARAARLAADKIVQTHYL